MCWIKLVGIRKRVLSLSYWIKKSDGLSFLGLRKECWIKLIGECWIRFVGLKSVGLIFLGIGKIVLD